MFYKRGKLPLGHFDPNPVNWTHIYRISRKIGFFDVKCQKMAFSPTTQNYVLVEISTGLEISTVKFVRQKLVRFSYTPYKYLSYCFITLENIQKVDCAISFRPHSTPFFPKLARSIRFEPKSAITTRKFDSTTVAVIQPY